MDCSELHTAISNARRIAIVRDAPLAEVLSAPGHRTLRNPAAVAAIAEEMRAGRWRDPPGEPILIGIFTRVADDGAVTLRALECLDGHHRMLAGLKAGVWRTIGDIPANALDTRVNGWRADGTETEPRWIPLAVAQRSRLPASAWREVPPEWGAKGPTAMIPGDVCGADDVFAASDRSLTFAELLAVGRSD